MEQHKTYEESQDAYGIVQKTDEAEARDMDARQHRDEGAGAAEETQGKNAYAGPAGRRPETT